MWALTWRIGVWLIFIGLGEWILHRYFMHAPWTRSCRLPFLRWVFRVHTEEHHGEHENDWRPHIALSFDSYIPAYIVLVVQLAFANYVGMLALTIACVAHATVWNVTHAAIHEVGCGWARWLPGFGLLERHHQGHHANPRTNFGIVWGLPFDYLFGTVNREPTGREDFVGDDLVGWRPMRGSWLHKKGPRR